MGFEWMGKLAVGYVRTSVEGEDAELFVSAQKQKIEQYAAEVGVQVSDWYVDVGYSGRGMEGTGVQRLLADARSEKPAFDVVLVWRYSRLGPDAVGLGWAKVVLRKSGVRLVSVSEPVGSGTVEQFCESVIQLFEEAYREIHSEATRRGIQAARRRRLQGE